MKIKTITSIALLAFVFLFVSLVLFGKFGSATDTQSTTTFKVGSFMLLLFIASIIYIMNISELEGFVQHITSIACLLFIVVLLSLTMQNIQQGYSTHISTVHIQQQLQNEVAVLERTVQNTDATQNDLEEQISLLSSQNEVLQLKIDTLSVKKSSLQKETQLQQTQNQFNAQQKEWELAWQKQEQEYEAALAQQKKEYEAAIAELQAALNAKTTTAPRGYDDD